MMIECNENINFGQPALRGRRLTVFDIVTKIYIEQDILFVLNDYGISLQDAIDATEYCSKLKCKEDKNLVHFGSGCLLRTLAEGWSFTQNDYVEVYKNDQLYTVSKDGKVYFFGSLEELENSEFGKVTWLIAEDVAKIINEQS